MTDKTLTQIDIEQLPHYQRETKDSFTSACPFCEAGEDRFIFWPAAGNYYCRRCEAKGFVGSAPVLTFSEADWQAWKAKEAERLRQEQLARLSTLDRLNQYNNAARYHHNLTCRDWWYEKGVNDASIERWQLGYTSICPTYPGSASYTIPVTYRARLYNIRHRLVTPNGSGKYRPEIKDLPPALFNADILDDELGFFSEIILVEGEIKTMVLMQQGFGAVGIPGATLFKPKWAKLFAGKNVFVMLDPGADREALRIWQMLGEAGVTVRLCSLACKPDDFFTLHGGRATELFSIAMMGRIYGEPQTLRGNGR